jgi:hypothetical protein
MGIIVIHMPLILYAIVCREDKPEPNRRPAAMPIQRPTLSVTYRFVDERGTTSTISFDATAQLPFDTIQRAAGAIGEHLTALSAARLVGYTITYSVMFEEHERSQPGSRVEHKGVISFGTAQGKTVTYQIPAIRPEVVTNERRLKQTPSLTALATLLMQEPWCDSNGERLTAFVAAYEVFRRTSRR